MSASAIAVTDPAWNSVFTPAGEKTVMPVPRALEAAEIPGIVEAFAQGARNAMAAGFDGVEVHAANGYLIQQFLNDSSNTRADAYGGSVENRARLCLEVMDAVVAAVGDSRKVGIRVGPYNFFLSCTDSNPAATYGYLVPELSKRKLGYLHLITPRQFEGATESDPSLAPFRAAFDGTVILAGGFERASGAKALAAGEGDAIAYGRWYLANPDLPKRFALNAELNAYDRDAFYNPMMPIKGCVKPGGIEGMHVFGAGVLTRARVASQLH